MIARAAALLAVIAIVAALAMACGSDPPPDYEVTVTFNDRFTQAGGDEVASIILEYDDDADIRLQESFPPVLRTTVASRRTDLCDELLRRIGGRPDVASMNCQPAASD